jgi:N-acetylglucosamine malate deacetylase 2
MSGKTIARRSRGAGVPPVWTSLLAVIAHPDDASSGLGAILDAFTVAGARAEVLCLTHGQAWALDGAPGDLAALRGAELVSAVDVLGVTHINVLDCPEGTLGHMCQTRLATQVVAIADSCHPDGLLVFDTSAGADHLDHGAAMSAGLLAAETLDLPVLGWTLTEAVAARLRREFGSRAAGRAQEIDLRVTLDRARQRLAGRLDAARAPAGNAARGPLDLLAQTQSLRWLRP